LGGASYAYGVFTFNVAHCVRLNVYRLIDRVGRRAAELAEGGILVAQTDRKHAPAGFQAVPADGLLVIMNAKGLDGSWLAFEQAAHGGCVPRETFRALQVV